MGYMNRIGGQYVLAGFLYSASLRQVAEVSSAMIPLDVKGVQSKMMAFEGRIARSMRRFPAERVVVVKPSIYQQAAQIAVAHAGTRRSDTRAGEPSPCTYAGSDRTAGTRHRANSTAVPASRCAGSITISATTTYADRESDLSAATDLSGTGSDPVAVSNDANSDSTCRASSGTRSAGASSTDARSAGTRGPSACTDCSAGACGSYSCASCTSTNSLRRPAPAPAPVVGETMEIEDETPVGKTWWLWTIVGAVVVGGAAAAGVLLAPGDEPPKNFNATATFE